MVGESRIRLIGYQNSYFWVLKPMGIWDCKVQSLVGLVAKQTYLEDFKVLYLVVVWQCWFNYLNFHKVSILEYGSSLRDWAMLILLVLLIHVFFFLFQLGCQIGVATADWGYCETRQCTEARHKRYGNHNGWRYRNDWTLEIHNGKMNEHFTTVSQTDGISHLVT